jgi:HK97 gp10 family phage protein
MGKGFVLDVRSFDKVLSNLESKKADIRRKADAAVDNNCQTIANNAINDAPVNMGDLRAAITVRRGNKELFREVVAQTVYAPFVEFGTMSYVDVPPELEEYAQQFRGQGKGENSAWSMISAWCERKGIDKKAWYPIYLSVMRNGIHPHPFMWPNVINQKPQLINDLKETIK